MSTDQNLPTAPPPTATAPPPMATPEVVEDPSTIEDQLDEANEIVDAQQQTIKELTAASEEKDKQIAALKHEAEKAKEEAETSASKALARAEQLTQKNEDLVEQLAAESHRAAKMEQERDAARIDARSAKDFSPDFTVAQNMLEAGVRQVAHKRKKADEKHQAEDAVYRNASATLPRDIVVRDDGKKQRFTHNGRTFTREGDAVTFVDNKVKPA